MAREFCRWLTERERAAGLLPDAEAFYRLPTDAEWSLAGASVEEEVLGESAPVTKRLAPMAGRFPWGTAFPPPAGTGNFAGEEVRGGPWPAEFPVLRGYRDAHRTTAPVGAFRTNRLGIADLAGNVWEWCEDGPQENQEQRWLRGGSWVDGGRKALGDGARARAVPQTRAAAFGFRVVLARP
jgi:formylglycine-generating enzyme required for sulfatase activity